MAESNSWRARDEDAGGAVHRRAVAAVTEVVAQSGGTAVVEAREIAFAAMMADRDFDAFLTFVSPEAVFLDGNEALRGRDAIASAWAPFFEGGQAPFSWHPDVVEVLASGELAPRPDR